MSDQQTKMNTVIRRLETVKIRLEFLAGGGGGARGASGVSGARGARGVDTIQTGAFKENIVKIDIHSH